MGEGQIIGILLAGGRSTRMGSDKALLSYCGVRLVDHMSALLKAGGADRVIVSGKIAENIEGVECIADEVPELGPLGGLHSVVSRLNKSPENLWVVVPVDMPLLEPAHICELWQRLGGFDAAKFSNYELPLALRGSVEVVDTITQVVNANAERRSRSIRVLLAGINTINFELAPSEVPKFVNLNTPEQWAAKIK
ncbi:molybdenum cofactor guanylyltransferase [Bdellovibrionota bacterium FG-2]